MMNFQMMTFSWILRSKKNEKGGFLEGTKLTGYSEQKPKKKGKLLKKAADTDKAAAETAEAAEDTENTGIKSSDDADNKPYIDAPMNFEIHRADTSPDTYEADNESQQQEDLPFEDAVTDRKKSVVSESEEDRPLFRMRRQCGRLRKPPNLLKRRYRAEL